MAIGVERRARKAASRLDRALLLESVNNAMSYNPSLHTSGVALPVTENSLLNASDGRPALGPPINNQPTAPPPHQQPLKKRRPSKDKAPSAIRRSSSTPHMRNLALSNSGELSPTADKRRNKLGYHRTSVACGKQNVCFFGKQSKLLTLRRRPLSSEKNKVSSRAG